MGSGKHNKPTHLAANYLETVGKNLTQDIPGFSEDWYVVLDKNTRVWDAKQDSRLWEQKQARKSFAKKVEALMREGKPMSDKAQALERERIDAIYASDEKPSGPAPQADAEVGLHSARHPSFMIETAFGQSAQRARQKATTWLMRTRHSVKYVMVLHLTYDRKPNGGPSDDLSASVKVYKLHLIQQGRTLRQRVVVHSEQVRYFPNQYFWSAALTPPFREFVAGMEDILAAKPIVSTCHFTMSYLEYASTNSRMM